MPVWVEIIIAWIIIVTVLNIAAVTVFRKRGYFKWLNALHDSEAYQRGYDDAKKGEISTGGQVYDSIPRSVLLREHGSEDNRYK